METEKRAMSPRELVDLAQKHRLFSDNIAGKTPYQTMKSKLSVHMRRYGHLSPFVRTGPGRFYLRALLDGRELAFEANPIRPPKSREGVLVFEAEELDTITTWQGLQTRWKKAAKQIFSTLKPLYIPRFDVEQDNRFTQILTYILVCRGNAVLAYRRGTYNRVDQFLRGAYCIGFGGHATADDLNLFNLDSLGIYDTAARELREELKLPEMDIERLRQHQGLEVIGIINDDSTDVGRRHLAFVMKYETSSDSYWNRPERGEKAITQVQWIAADAPDRVEVWNFEYWSQLCLREFTSELTLARSAYRLIRRSLLKPPHILCVIGPVGSGKTVATEVLKNEFGYREINTGRVMAELLDIPPVPQTPRREFQQKAWQFIQRSDGPARLARRLVEIARNIDSDRLLVDGLRQKATLDALRSLCRGSRMGVLFVQTPADLAYSFYAERIAQGASIQEFLDVRNAAVEAEVDDLLTEADAVLYNWTGRLKYKKTIRSMMANLGIARQRS
jgi:predicted NUDIX family phosphoesterase